jgi:hypothetical protein
LAIILTGTGTLSPPDPPQAPAQPIVVPAKRRLHRRTVFDIGHFFCDEMG